MQNDVSSIGLSSVSNYHSNDSTPKSITSSLGRGRGRSKKSIFQKAGVKSARPGGQKSKFYVMKLQQQNEIDEENYTSSSVSAEE